MAESESPCRTSAHKIRSSRRTLTSCTPPQSIARLIGTYQAKTVSRRESDNEVNDGDSYREIITERDTVEGDPILNLGVLKAQVSEHADGELYTRDERKRTRGNIWYSLRIWRIIEATYLHHRCGSTSRRL